MYLGFTATGTVLSGQAIGQLTGLSDSAGIFIFAAFIVLVTVLGYRVIHIIGRIASVLGIIAFAYLFSRLMLLSDMATRSPSAISAGLVPPRGVAGGVLADRLRPLRGRLFTLPAGVHLVVEDLPRRRLRLGALGARWSSGVLAALANGQFAGREVAYIVGLGSSGTVAAALFQHRLRQGDHFHAELLRQLPCIATIISSVRGQLEITRVQRLFFLAIVGASTLIALLGQHSFLAAFKSFILFLLTFFTPWSAVNLVDYYFITRERYDVPALADPDGRYGRWNPPGIAVYTPACWCRCRSWRPRCTPDRWSSTSAAWISPDHRLAGAGGPLLPGGAAQGHAPGPGANDPAGRSRRLRTSRARAPRRISRRRGRLQSHETPPADGAAEPAEPNKEPSMSLHLKPGHPWPTCAKPYLAPVRLSLIPAPTRRSPPASPVSRTSSPRVAPPTASTPASACWPRRGSPGRPGEAPAFHRPVPCRRRRRGAGRRHGAAGHAAQGEQPGARVLRHPPQQIDALIALINAEVYPHIPLKGSVVRPATCAAGAHVAGADRRKPGAPSR